MKFERKEIDNFGENCQYQYQAMVRALYSKKSIQNEILHFNFLKQAWVVDSQTGLFEVRNNQKTLTSPRPNQKYGVDLVASTVHEMYQHEGEPNYNEVSLRKKLESFNLSEIEIATEIEKRKDFVSRKEFTLLLQYAAGFGKTFVLGWIASRLLDLKDANNQFLFEKILIVVDRLDLKDQMELALRSQNLTQDQYRAIDNKEEFKTAFSNSRTRVIIVNIQKFRDKEKIKDLFSISKAGQRTAILIDEIHRSNSGTMHNEMSNLFEDLSFFAGDATDKKRNLIVGVTATPQDTVLLKFGDVRYKPGGVYSVPHDVYSMNQSIQEGYTLNPIKHLIPLSMVLGLNNEQDVEDITDTEIYVNDATKLFDPIIKNIVGIDPNESDRDIKIRNAFKQQQEKFEQPPTTLLPKLFDTLLEPPPINE